MVFYLGNDETILTFYGEHLRHFFRLQYAAIMLDLPFSEPLRRLKIFIDMYYPNLSEQGHTGSINHSSQSYL